MNGKLKNLYTYLIYYRKHELQNWHDSYEIFYGEVDNRRQRINNGEKLNGNDKPFLRKLLYDQDNGITSRGQSVLSDENFEIFIKNEYFLSSLSNFIADPSKELFEQFQKAWDEKKSNNPLLINRVAAACTLNVSTTVDYGRFNRVFNWLTQEEIINPPKEVQG